MTESFDHLKRLFDQEDAEVVFFDTIGQIFFELEMYKGLHKTPTSEDLNKINEMKNKFYQAIDGFLKKNLEPKGMITPEAVKEFYKFRDFDWSVEENTDQVRQYLESLDPKRQKYQPEP